MGTRGFFAYRFRGRYYLFYNHWDSYPEGGLGADIVNGIPKDPEEYQQWLKNLHHQLNKWEQMLLTKVLAIPDTVIHALHSGLAFVEPRFKAYLDERMENTPSYALPRNDLYIEWVYIIDLDNDLFIVDNGAHFELSHVLDIDSWHNALELRRHRRVLNLHWVSEESVPYRARGAKDLGQECAALLSNVTYVKAKGFDALPRNSRAGAILMHKIWEGFRRELEDSLPYTPLQLRPTDFAFREIAFSILSLAAGLPGSVALLDCNQALDNIADDWIAVKSNNPSKPADIVSLVGRGYHREGTKPGSGPEDTTYWFRNVVVHLAADLKSTKNIEQAITETIEFGRSTAPSRRPFNAVIMSIRHIILLWYSSPTIERTQVMPLVVVKADDDEHFSEHCILPEMNKSGDAGNELEEPSETASVSRLSAEDSRESSEDEGTDPGNGCVLDSSFFALMHLFEAGRRGSLKPEQKKEGIFQTEIYSEILKHVDRETQRICAEVSHTFHDLCQHRIFVSDDLVLEKYDSSKDSFRFWDIALEECADMSLIYLPCRGKASEGRRFFVTYGYDIDNRFNQTASSSLSMLGTCSFRVHYNNGSEARRRKVKHFKAEERASIRNSHTLDCPSKEPAEHFWEDRRILGKAQSLDSYCSFNYSETLSLRNAHQMWDKILQRYELRVSEGSNVRLKEPAHTVTLGAEVVKKLEDSVGGGEEESYGAELFFQVYIGRPNAFYDIDGTFNRLHSRAERHLRTCLVKLKQDWTAVLVLLAVEHFVELYQYDSKDMSLKPWERTRRKRLGLFKEGDREEVEDFLQNVKATGRQAQAAITRPKDDRASWDDVGMGLYGQTCPLD